MDQVSVNIKQQKSIQISRVSVWTNEQQRHTVLFTYTEAHVTLAHGDFSVCHLNEDIMSYYVMTYFCSLIFTDTGLYRNLI